VVNSLPRGFGARHRLVMAAIFAEFSRAPGLRLEDWQDEK